MARVGYIIHCIVLADLQHLGLQLSNGIPFTAGNGGMHIVLKKKICSTTVILQKLMARCMLSATWQIIA